MFTLRQSHGVFASPMTLMALYESRIMKSGTPLKAVARVVFVGTLREWRERRVLQLEVIVVRYCWDSDFINGITGSEGDLI